MRDGRAYRHNHVQWKRGLPATAGATMWHVERDFEFYTTIAN